MSDALRDLGTVDKALYDAVAHSSTPTLDEPLRVLSRSANRSLLWLGIAGTLAAVGGRRGQRAAVRGVVSIGVTSVIVNIGLKSLHRRDRPDRDASDAPAMRHVLMPKSTSFPSGHSASAFAFTHAVGVEIPALAFPMRVLATAVAYSRVHTGVHYPGDVLAGSIIGATTGQLVTRAIDHFTDVRHR